MTYEEVNIGKYATTRHFKLINSSFLIKPFTELLNIASDRGFAKSNPNYWVKTRSGVKWSKNALTGIFETTIPNVYYGDLKKKGIKSNSVIFKFESGNLLKIYLFDFYTTNLNQLI